MKILWISIAMALSVIIVILGRKMMRKPTILIKKWKKMGVVIGTIALILVMLTTVETIEGKVMKFPTPEEAVMYTHSVVMPANKVYMIDYVLDGEDTTAVFLRTTGGASSSYLLRKENGKWRIENQFNHMMDRYTIKDNGKVSTITLHTYKGTKDCYLVINETIDSIENEIYDISDNLNTEFVKIFIDDKENIKYSNKYYAYLYDLDKDNYVLTINGEEVKFKDLYRLS